MPLWAGSWCHEGLKFPKGDSCHSGKSRCYELDSSTVERAGIDMGKNIDRVLNVRLRPRTMLVTLSWLRRIDRKPVILLGAYLGRTPPTAQPETNLSTSSPGL